MTTVNDLVNMPSTTASDVALYFLDQTLLSQSGSKLSANGLIRETEYTYDAGSLGYTTTVTVRVQLNPVDGVQRHTLKLSTTQTVVVDGVLTEEEPMDVEIRWNVKGYMRDVTKTLRMLGTAFSLCFNGVTSKVPNEVIMTRMARGITEKLYD